jgi:hypothetical protein
MIALDTAAGFVRALQHSRSVALSSYTLRPGEVVDALAAAARRGAAVRVRIERDPFDDPTGRLHRADAAALAELRAAGAAAVTTRPGEPVLHLKAAVVDGTAWLCDRDWAAGGAEQILRDTDPEDVAAVGSAAAGGPGAGRHLATTKSGALQLEAALIRDAGNAPLLVETEAFGTAALYRALLQRGAAGLPTRLIVAGREVGEGRNRGEAARLRRLEAAGIAVRVGDRGPRDLNEKLAIAAGTAWLGSANATWAGGAAGAQRDWGLTTREPAVVDGLRAAFERNWSAARGLAAPGAGAANTSA